MGRSESDKDFVKMAEKGKSGKIGNNEATDEEIKEFNKLVMLAEDSRKVERKPLERLLVS